MKKLIIVLAMMTIAGMAQAESSQIISQNLALELSTDFINEVIQTKTITEEQEIYIEFIRINRKVFSHCVATELYGEGAQYIRLLKIDGMSNEPNKHSLIDWMDELLAICGGRTISGSINN